MRKCFEKRLNAFETKLILETKLVVNKIIFRNVFPGISENCNFIDNSAAKC